MKVFVSGNYDTLVYYNQSPGKKGVWNTMQLTENKNEAEIIVICNKPPRDFIVKSRENGKILLIQEPPYAKNNYLKSYFRFFDTVFSGFENENKNHINIPALLPWHIGKNYDELVAIKAPEPLLKKNKLVWVTSTSNMNPGHKPRLDFLEALKKSDLPVELFGRGIRQIDSKFDVLYQTKYAIAVENYSGNDYWTEKIADAYLAWCMPVYFGCRNIDKYFPPDSYFLIDINKIEYSLERLKELVNSDAWDQNIRAIEEARNLVLNRYNFFPYLESNILPGISEKRKKSFIPANPSALPSRIKNLFINKK